MSRKCQLTIGLLFLTLTISTLSILPGCSKKDDGVIRIGVITPLTGEGATYGAATKKGVDLAVSHINSNGGVDGKKVAVVYEDSEINPVKGTQVFNKLVSIDKVPVILGAFGSSVSLALAPLAEKNKTVLFSASSTADALATAGDYFFRNVPPNSRQGSSAADFVANKLQLKQVAILSMNNDYGISLTKAFKIRSADLNLEVVAEETFNPSDRDFRTQLAKLKSSNPDIVFFPGHYQESGQILIQARELGIDVPFIGGDGSYSPQLIDIAGSAAEGSYYTLMALGYGISDSLINAFTSSFETKYGEDPDVYSGYAYDAVHVIVDAIKRGGYTADGIRDALYKTNNLLGVTGYTTFDKLGEVDKAFHVYEVVNGRFEIIAQ